MAVQLSPEVVQQLQAWQAQQKASQADKSKEQAKAGMSDNAMRAIKQGLNPYGREDPSHDRWEIRHQHAILVIQADIDKAHISRKAKDGYHRVIDKLFHQDFVIACHTPPQLKEQQYLFETMMWDVWIIADESDRLNDEFYGLRKEIESEFVALLSRSTGIEREHQAKTTTEIRSSWDDKTFARAPGQNEARRQGIMGRVFGR